MAVHQLRTREADLRAIFEKAITLRHIASRLVSIDGATPAADAWKCMSEKGFDVIGVCVNDMPVGYARGDELTVGTLSEYARPFPDDQSLPADTPLTEVLRPIHEKSRVYVTEGAKVCGIATRADLQKLPVRMYLFGLVTLIEMNLLSLLRDHREMNWKSMLSAERLEKAKDTYRKRQERGVESDLDDCLEFSDKYTILLKTEWFASALHMKKRPARSLFTQIRAQRDDVAHAQTLCLNEAILQAPALLAALEEMRPLPH